MSIFLRQSERYGEALETLDPLRGEWLFQVLDSWRSGGQDAQPAWRRMAVFALLLLVPMVVFSSIPSPFLGGHLLGLGGFAADIGVYAMVLFFLAYLVLIPLARRLLGDLVNELVRGGVTGASFRDVDTADTGTGRWMRLLTCVMRVDGWRGILWYMLILAYQILVYAAFLDDGKLTWHSSPVAHQTFLSVFSFGNEQPNVAGAWSFLIFNPIVGYLIVLAARLNVAYARVCASLARQKRLDIVPSHPDGVGGLGVIGQTGLFFSLFPFVIGVLLAGLTGQELIVNAVLGTAAPHGETNLRLLFFLWLLYLTFGSLLFFLPVLPLKRRMARAKRAYLLELEDLRSEAERFHREKLRRKNFDPDSLAGLTSLNELMRIATGMTVWPFDRRTFLRYAGLLISPLAPLLADQLPGILAWLKTYLGLGGG